MTEKMQFPSGFTLAETLVVVGLVAVLIGVGATIFFYNNRFYETQSGEIFSINATREAADRINELAREALNFEPSYLYDSTNYMTGTSTLILRLPAVDTAGQVIADTFDFAIISRHPAALNRLELYVIPDPASVRPPRQLLLSDKLTGLDFSYDNADLELARKVAYQIMVTDIGRSPASEEIFGSATLRNK